MNQCRQWIERAPLSALMLAARALRREGMALDTVLHTVQDVYGRPRTSAAPPVVRTSRAPRG